MATGYGTEVSLTDKLVTGRLVTGRAVVIEALYRRLITPRGTLPDDLTYGFDVSAYVGHVGTDRAIRTIGGMVANQLAHDDRVTGVVCQVIVSTLDNGTKRLELAVTGQLVDDGEDFSLTVAIADGTTSLLQAS